MLNVHIFYALIISQADRSINIQNVPNFFHPSYIRSLIYQQTPALRVSICITSRQDFSHRSCYYSASSPAFQLILPTIPSAVSPWLPCQVLVMLSVPLPKLPSTAAPMMICHTFTALPLLPFLIVFIL